MSDDAGGCMIAMLLAVGLLLACYNFGESNGRQDGYRRGYCEGRGGVEATVGDSIRCIQPPETVRTK